MTAYESKSTGWWLFGIAGFLVVLGLVLAVIFAIGARPEALIGVALVALGLLVANFGVLTVRVTGAVVSWHFGRGPIGWTVPLERVVGVEARRSPWYWGWGIRWTTHGWLWRAHGLDAVWIELDSGRSVGVGTQDPDGLVRALRRAVESRP
ncbi:hypothetical protein [Engelhardtia mirabilis]|uniref:Bacterial Pleckstrin homology domain-containing protein n=1 Tax=Engelhardtia mirabilis TaxID=2528011 RepID=A0A518BED8_9BACT|nr:hypothetical protein Pla133_03070 [Planctomycetes bacterium Pla133]QDU99569.1 hypothetical protein Pla86_03070 [Planctomycetes bacterium Pla86]